MTIAYDILNIYIYIYIKKHIFNCNKYFVKKSTTEQLFKRSTSLKLKQWRNAKLVIFIRLVNMRYLTSHQASNFDDVVLEKGYGSQVPVNALELELLIL